MLSAGADALPNTADADTGASMSVVNANFSVEDASTLYHMLLQIEQHIDGLGTDSSATKIGTAAGAGGAAAAPQSSASGRTLAEQLGLPRDTIIEDGRFIYDLLRHFGIDFGTKHLMMELIDNIIQYLVAQQSIAGSAVAGGKALALEGFRQILDRVFRDETAAFELCKYFKVVIQTPIERGGNNSNNGGGRQGQQVGHGGSMFAMRTKKGRTLSYWCFSPGIAMRELKSLGVRSVVLTSGTLSPMDSYAAELQLPFPIRLENSHVIDRDQVYMAVLTKGVTNKALNSTYDNREKPEYLRELGNTIANIVRIVPDGLLIFFASYTHMEKCVAFWQSDSAGRIWTTIKQYKEPVVEPRSSAEFAECIKAFNTAVDSKRGAVLLGVCRGKVSEGIDFADARGRAVIVTGLPYPPRYDPQVVLKQRFCDEQRANAINTAAAAATTGAAGAAKTISKSGKGTSSSSNSAVADPSTRYISGGAWYQQQAFRAVNQAIGRVIRHRRDYGAVLLLDERFARDRDNLSAWLRPFFTIAGNMGQVQMGLAGFFKNAQVKYAVGLNAIGGGAYSSGSGSGGTTGMNFTLSNGVADVGTSTTGGVGGGAGAVSSYSGVSYGYSYEPGAASGSSALQPAQPPGGSSGGVPLDGGGGAAGGGNRASSTSSAATGSGLFAPAQSSRSALASTPSTASAAALSSASRGSAAPASASAVSQLDPQGPPASASSAGATAAGSASMPAVRPQGRPQAAPAAAAAAAAAQRSREPTGPVSLFDALSTATTTTAASSSSSALGANNGGSSTSNSGRPSLQPGSMPGAAVASSVAATYFSGGPASSRPAPAPAAASLSRLGSKTVAVAVQPAAVAAASASTSASSAAPAQSSSSASSSSVAAAAAATAGPAAPPAVDAKAFLSRLHAFIGSADWRVLKAAISDYTAWSRREISTASTASAGATAAAATSSAGGAGATPLDAAASKEANVVALINQLAAMVQKHIDDDVDAAGAEAAGTGGEAVASRRQRRHSEAISLIRDFGPFAPKPRSSGSNNAGGKDSAGGGSSSSSSGHNGIIQDAIRNAVASLGSANAGRINGADQDAPLTSTATSASTTSAAAAATSLHDAKRQRTG